MAVGQPIMTGSFVSGNSRTIVVKRGSTTLSNGASYVAGETLSVSLSSTSGGINYLIQVASGGATINGGSCSSKRAANQAVTIVMPSSGNVVLNGGSAIQEGSVSMTANFNLIAPAVVNPSVIPTVRPTVVPTCVPTTVPSFVPTVVPSLLPTALPTVVPTTSKFFASFKNRLLFTAFLLQL